MVTQKLIAGPFSDGSTQELDVAFTVDMPVVGAAAHTFGKPGHSQAIVSFGAITPPAPPPPSDAPNIPPAFLQSIGVTVGTRLDPGDAVMLNPSHWKLNAHSQGNGSATTNNPAFARFGQSFYGGPTDSYLHCSIAQGQGLWMVGDVMPAPPAKWIVEFSVKCGGSNATHAYGWGTGWLNTPGTTSSYGQELDIMESVNWGSGEQGYGSSTLHDYTDGDPGGGNSAYFPSFPVADGNFHTYTLIWDPVRALLWVVWDGVAKRSALAIPHPSYLMQLQIMTGYTIGTQPPVWDARADNVYSYFRYWAAT